eukprot:2022665-Ditylum_brightwellii.AAC.1
MQPASVSCTIENRACLCRSGRMWPRHACVGSIGKSALHEWDNCTPHPSGIVMLIGVFVGWMTVDGL